MISKFEDIPQRIFLDSSTLQTLLTYGGFLYERESLRPTDRVHRDPKGIAKLEALRTIMQIAERAPFEFALSTNSFVEVEARGTPDISSGHMMSSTIGSCVSKNPGNCAPK